MQLSGTRFGQIEFDDGGVITLPNGVIGFPRETRFVLLAPQRQGSVSWLQSVATPSLAFPVLDSASFAETYSDVEKKDFATQAALGEEEILALVVVVPRKDSGQLVPNMLAPIVVGGESRRGAQVVAARRRS